jgi:hypothetical protein
VNSAVALAVGDEHENYKACSGIPRQQTLPVIDAAVAESGTKANSNSRGFIRFHSSEGRHSILHTRVKWNPHPGTLLIGQCAPWCVLSTRCSLYLH